MHPSSIAKRVFVLLFLAFLVVYFYGLAHFPLLGPDEPRYAQVAREMFLRGDFITPTLGGHLWFEKPALLYWLMIGSYKLFGVSEWSARFGPALSGVLTVLGIFWLATRVERASTNEEAAGLSLWSLIAAGSTLGLLVFARAASFDIIITMTISWTLAFFFVSEIDKNKGRWLAGFYVFVGLSLLAKGLVGIVIPFGIIGAYYLLGRRTPDRKTVFSLLWGLPLAAAVAALWYGPVIARHGWPFIDQFFVQHHFARYTSSKYHHPGPIYFYFLIIIALSLPWSVFLVDGLLKTGKLFRKQQGAAALQKFRHFTAAWIFFPLLFFTFSGSKLPGYILPVIPAAALIAGTRLSAINFRRESRWPIRATAVLALVFAVAIIIYSRQPQGFSLTCALMVAVPLMITGVFGLVWAGRPDTFILITSGVTLIAILVLLNCGIDKPVERQNSKRLLALADERGHSGAIIFGMQRDDRTPEFYAGGRVVYDKTGEPVMYEGHGQIIWESRQRQAKILAFVPIKDVEQFLQLSSMRTDFVGDNGKFALIAIWPP